MYFYDFKFHRLLLPKIIMIGKCIFKIVKTSNEVCSESGSAFWSDCFSLNHPSYFLSEGIWYEFKTDGIRHLGVLQ